MHAHMELYGYGAYSACGSSGSYSLTSGTLMWSNTWTTPSTTPTGLILNLVDFSIGPVNNSGNVCHSLYCCSNLSGNFNPGICQGYPWLPLYYGKFSGVTVGPSQTVSYYLYLV